jgi:hypothetical protein
MNAKESCFGTFQQGKPFKCLPQLHWRTLKAPFMPIKMSIIILINQQFFNGKNPAPPS